MGESVKMFGGGGVHLGGYVRVMGRRDNSPFFVPHTFISPPPSVTSAFV